jgi:PKD repeat protein
MLNPGPPVPESARHPPPVPYFFITGLCYGDSTHLINKTTGIISSEWAITNDKGDTIYKSTNENATYYFKKRGYYEICLSTYNGHTAIKKRVIHVDTVTKANCSFRFCYDEFDNLSACSDQYIWVLPDNSTSTDPFPTYKFSSPGNYPVKLIAKKGNHADTLQKFIQVRGDSIGLPNASFTSKLLDASSTFLFVATDSLADTYSWYFGDNFGDDTSGYKVVHHIDKSVYKPPVNLFVTNGCGVSIDMLDPFAVTEVPSGIQKEAEISIYPNPASNEFKLKINDIAGSTCDVQLMDIRGAVINERRVLNERKEMTISIDVHALSDGIYLLQLKTEQGIWREKIMITK